MDLIEDIIKFLTPLERKIIPLLKENSNLNSLVYKSGLTETEVNRALSWLNNKKLINISEEKKEIIDLDNNGKNYLKNSLPERRFLNSLQEPLNLEEIKNKSCLDNDELRISLGILKKKNAIEIKEKVSLTENGKKLLNIEFPEEKLLRKLPLNLNKLSNEENLVLLELKKRKEIVKIESLTNKIISLTDLGSKILEKGLKENLLESLTIEILKTGSWKNKEFRHYNINSLTPKIYAGRIHPMSLIVEKIKKIF